MPALLCTQNGHVTMLLQHCYSVIGQAAQATVLLSKKKAEATVCNSKTYCKIKNFAV